MVPPGGNGKIRSVLKLSCIWAVWYQFTRHTQCSKIPSEVCTSFLPCYSCVDRAGKTDRFSGTRSYFSRSVWLLRFSRYTIVYRFSNILQIPDFATSTVEDFLTSNLLFYWSLTEGSKIVFFPSNFQISTIITFFKSTNRMDLFFYSFYFRTLLRYIVLDLYSYVIHYIRTSG